MASRDQERPISSRATPAAGHLRLLAKVARMYHERGVRQPEIAAALSISQPRVSRLLKEATARGIVRTVVVLPDGVHTSIEEELQQRYHLRDAVVVDAEGAEGNVTPALAAAGAAYLDATLKGGDVIGISSWSETLLAAVDAMQPKSSQVAEKVVQVVGGVGNPEVQVHATRLTGRLAELTGAQPMFAPSPWLVGSAAIREAVSQDDAVAAVMESWKELTLLLVGIGSLEPSPLLRRSGNAVSEDQQEELRSLGAVGDVCLRFFDAEGSPIASQLDERVVGISAADLRSIDRRVAFAGGIRKLSAIRAALLGGWVNVLVTDLSVAQHLLQDPAEAGQQ